MKTIEIVGENYAGSWDRTRVACRGVVVRDGMILLSCETATDVWMIPGGGLEGDESEEMCCVREVAEETGVVVKPSDCALEIDEYYENCRYVSLYFFCEPVGQTEPRLTEREIEVRLEPRWLPVGEAAALFSRHADYADTDEEKRGLYLREYTALRDMFGAAEREKGAGDAI